VMRNRRVRGCCLGLDCGSRYSGSDGNRVGYLIPVARGRAMMVPSISAVDDNRCT
jgi:hypothetical protein